MLVSADPPQDSRRFREKLGIPFPMASDEAHAVADRYGVAISHRHPKAWSYQDGFTQPAIFAFQGEESVYTYVAEPRLTNLYGAAGRPSADALLAGLRAGLKARAT